MTPLSAVIAADRDAIKLACQALALRGHPVDDQAFMLLRPADASVSAAPEQPPTADEAAERAGLCRALTARELEVLALVCDGLSNPEIGDRLGIERSTVKTHVARISRVLGATDRANAAYLALSHGLLAWSLP